MDDSELDFVDLCSRLLKRVRKKEPGRPSRKAEEQQSSSQATRGDKRTVDKQDGDSLSGFSATGSEVVCGRTGCDSGDAVQYSAVPPADADLRAKDKVLLRMQEFKRASPQKMTHSNRIGPAKKDGCTLTVQHQKAGNATIIPTQTKPFLPSAASPRSDPRSEPPESDEALALRLQRELDREAAKAQIVDLEDGGLFFCQICHRDLSHMTPEGRTQHLNRCLDQDEQSAPSLPPPSAVPDCPICGKKFKSQKSRSAHLKRCSADMGVSPAVLLQALQRQAEESRSSANAHLETGGIKRKAPPQPALPARKKPRKKSDRLDEDTMVALALSSSLLEQQKEQQVQSGPPHSSVTPLLTWKPDAAKGRVRKKKVAVPRPPPLLLVQDAETALARLQERVSALLLRRRAPSPPTPTRCPSKLPGWTGAAPLWRKSTLLDGGSTCPSQFYAAELQHLFTTADLSKPDAVLSSSSNKPESSVPPALPSCSQTSSPSTPGWGELHVGSQAIRDLMELAEDGMTLTQYGYADKAKHLSGFIQEEESEDQAEPSDDTAGSSSRTVRRSDQPEAERDAARHESVALSRLSSDLSSMVNNPQLSDLQLQVDSGEVYFAHSFMVYARCPLLAEMVHESGFGVQEEGTAAAQRVLLSDVPGQAVLAVLRYLYTARCCVAAPLRPHVLELASRFDLQELERLCHFQPENMAAAGDDGLDVNQEENVNNQTDSAFVELLRSMWNEEDSDGGGRSEEDRPEDEVAPGDGEIGEERVNEEELEEIYEFAATQRQRVKEEEEEKDAEPEPGSDRSYSRLFSQSWDGEASSSPPLLPHEASPKHSARTLLQSSASIADEPSLNLPVPGPSPGRPAPEDRHGRGEEATAEIRARRSATPSPARRDEAELIVLSDSSEEAEADRSFTGIKPGQNPSPTESVCGSQFSPGDPAGCSPELSWLVPSTPVRSPVGSTRTASVQTDSSMCRTRLFPRMDPSHTFSPSRNPIPTSSTPLKASAERQVSPDKRRSTEAFGANRSFRDSSKHEAPLQPRSISSTSGQMKARTHMSNPSGQSSSSSPVESSVQPGVSDTNDVTSVPDVRDSSFQQSFMDEPPIAFNDSWGLDACADGDPGGFSLKLDDTRESSSGGRPEASRPTASSSVQNPAAGPGPLTTPEVHNDLLDSKIWGSWEGDGGAGEEEDEEEEEGLPLSQRANPAALLQTPKSWKQTRRRPPVPITPMPHYSDMDTPELKNKLSSFGVRPLPKRQMVLKLKEIHQYTHQLTSSEEEEEEEGEEAPLGRAVSCARFKEPTAPAAASSPVKTNQEEAGDPLSASQGSNASSTAASDESESRSNPELVLSSDGDSDSDVSSSQAASRLQDRLQAVRSFILSDSDLYGRILQYQPLVLSQLQQQLKAAGIRLGAAKLVDYLDSQCITFTTAKPGHHAAGRRRGAWTGRGARGGGRKNGALKR
ncbi:structure-specific endonuclease subunit SLX4 isoform X1 [Poecilia formosa]|uniref:structure-specific endonuclease subunit SLX4 isoform X1 n=1 Tax=Poecilia formosa TaxID=48698 RepID=UPI0007BAA1CB|nr:PREDICTED: structure-specific endonuclease subunit SLX4 isoform X1 [Poecilia formosa]